ncbi:hypothetical protein FSP39_022244 [Pinctada imbricata]|uniref:Kinesin motor domain-containing protein n=1 Tax=Pinctada imbricata TaxID=66713 RepID=A0AA88YJ56_PINIB|nr:hypothetical protein FSP39_022244 [Pinctada imbricata]
MNGTTTTIEDPTGSEEPRKFTFDHSYWSHDGSKEGSDGYYAPDTSHPNGKKFADQKKVYNDLGKEVLNNAWEGYNSTLFAYGQTGSGKSWSVVGYGINKGIVPMFCDDIFTHIETKKGEGAETEFEVTFSMLEIYNEQVRDLLDPKPRKGGLKVRQHPKQGFYAEGLKIVPVSNYADIEKRMEEGTTNRTVASTKMNATSSRAHTIVGITFVQKFKNAAGEDTTKTAITNLVDLAGSERADSTGATGDRLKEGAAINQSLSCLGNVIAALADRSAGKNTRDQELYLRNEDPTEKLIRELQEENERLKAALASGDININDITGGGGDDDDDLTDEERAQIKAEMEDQYKSILEKNQLEMEEMRKTFEEKLKETQGTGTDFAAIAEKKKTTAHLSNLNMDPQLSGHIVHFIETPEAVLGSGGEIVIRGPSVAEKHAKIINEGGKFMIEPCDATNRTLHNGKACATREPLEHNDRLIFGTTQYFVFMNPAGKKSGQNYPEITFEVANEEVGTKAGFDLKGGNKSRDDALLQDDLMEMMPAIEEANSISQALDKKMKFELAIVSPEARGELTGRTEVMVHVVDLETKHEWLWSKEKFMNRKYVMVEMYDDYEDGDEWQKPPEKDPFIDDVNAEFLIGSVKVWLQSMSYLIESNEQLDIIDYKGAECGKMNIEIVPCSSAGKDFTEADDVFVETPKELVGKEVNFKVKITSARGLPKKFTEMYAKFKVFIDENWKQTKKIKDTPNPDWNFSEVFKYPKATEELITYLSDKAIMVQIWGKQKPPKEKKTINTKDALTKATLNKGQVHCC